jgi:hypothetical protein
MKTSRVHIVLVPGFAGFDALGQLEYYAGVTPLLRTQNGNEGTPVVLHYFDNLPTASVATRALRLRHYLAKRFARGEFQHGDRVALVGHSTGGLDIRRLLLDLDRDKNGAFIEVDGSRNHSFQVPAAELLQLVQRVAFLSVPQWGTNIASWVRRRPRRMMLAMLRLIVRAANLSVPNDVEELAVEGLAYAARADILRAARDAIGEMDATAVKGDPARCADAHEAASELELFLRHIASDFAAIDDLAADPHPDHVSPAHFTKEERRNEQAMWRRCGIDTRSYATIGKRPYDFKPGEVVPPWEPLHFRSGPWSRLMPGVRAQTDLVYLCAYRACAGGPFGISVAPRQLVATPLETPLGTSQPRLVETWDNDGIVNTASMLWPDAEKTILVDGDHGDIIGHFRLVEAPPDSMPLRRYHTYDLLRSDSGFTKDTFERVWRDVLTFCSASGGTVPAEKVA